MGDLPLWLQQLLYQTPLLLVYVLGLLLGLAYLRRCPGPALLTVLGCADLLLFTFAALAIQAVLYQQLREGAIPNQRYAELLMVVGLVGNGGRAIGLALVVALVFAGRGRPPQPDPETYD